MKNSFTVHVLFGQEYISKFNSNEKFLKKDFDMNCLQSFSFETEKELVAFKKGIDLGVGWYEYQILNEKEFIKISKK